MITKVPNRWNLFAIMSLLGLYGYLGSASGQSPEQPATPWKWPTRGAGPCEYHPIPAGSIPLVATIPETSQSLKGDGLGRYWQGNDTVRSYTHGAYNFFTYWPETCEAPLPRKVRSLEFRLDSPETGAKPVGAIRDQSAMVHIFPLTPLQDMPVGQPATVRRALLRFQRNGKIYFLRFGTETFDPALPLYVELLPGQGTSVPSVTRVSETKWMISAPPGSLGRLSIWGANPVDLGLYRFSFEIRLDVPQISWN